MKKIFTTLPHIRLYLLLCLTASLLMAGCKKTPSYVKLIPADASFVVAVNTNSMATKAISWSDIFNTDIFKNLGGEEKKDAGKKVPSPGLDILQTAFMFGNLNTANKDNNYLAAVFQLSNEADFETFIKYVDASATTKTQEGIKYIYGKKFVVSWQGNTAIAIAGVAPKKFDASQAEKTIKRLRSLENEQILMQKNKQFQELQKSSFDIAFWMHLGDFNKIFKDATSAYLALFDLSLSDHYLTATTNFAKGEIETKAQYHFPDMVAEEYKKLFKKQSNGELIKNVPMENPLAALSLVLDMKYIKDGLKATGFEGLADRQASALMGMSAAQMLNIFTGDIALASREVKLMEESTLDINPETGEPEAKTNLYPVPNLVVALGINNKQAIENILKNFTKGDEKILDKKEGFFVSRATSQIFYLIPHEKVLYFTNDEVSKNNFLNTKNKEKMNSKVVEVSKGSYFAYWMDVQEKSLSKVPTSFLPTPELAKQNLITNISFKAKTIKDQTADFEAKIYFKNQQQNALRTLIESANKISKLLDKPTTTKPVQ